MLYSRGRLAELGLAVLAFLVPGLANAAEPQPNVVLILADDLGWADLGCYGSKYHKTPHLDRLAADGDAVHARLRRLPGLLADAGRDHDRQVPAAARHHRLAARPARPARPEARTGRSSSPSCRASEITLAEAFKKAGYATGHIGKWHLGGKGLRPHGARLRRQHRRRPHRHAAQLLRPVRGKKDKRVMPGLEKAPDGEYLTDRLAAEAEKFIDAQQGQAVLPLPAALRRPHAAAGEGGRDREVQAGPSRASRATRSTRRCSRASTTRVGRVLKKLDELKLTERTIVDLHVRQRRPGDARRGRTRRRRSTRRSARARATCTRAASACR